MCRTFAAWASDHCEGPLQRECHDTGVPPSRLAEPRLLVDAGGQLI